MLVRFRLIFWRGECECSRRVECKWSWRGECECSWRVECERLLRGWYGKMRRGEQFRDERGDGEHRGSTESGQL